MKRVISFVLTLIICGGLLSCFAGTAMAAATSVTFSVSSAQGAVGDVVAIDVSVSGRSNIGALEFSIPVDTKYLESTYTLDYRGRKTYYTIGSAARGATVMASDGVVPGTNEIQLALACANGLWDAGVLCTFYFKIIRALPASGVALNCRVNSIIDCEASSQPFNVSTVKGWIKPTPVASSTPKPPVSSTPKPPVSSTPRPSTSSTVKPSTSSTPKPSTPSTVKPSTPATSSVVPPVSNATVPSVAPNGSQILVPPSVPSEFGTVSQTEPVQSVVSDPTISANAIQTAKPNGLFGKWLGSMKNILLLALFAVVALILAIVVVTVLLIKRKK